MNPVNLPPGSDQLVFILVVTPGTVVTAACALAFLLVILYSAWHLYKDRPL